MLAKGGRAGEQGHGRGRGGKTKERRRESRRERERGGSQRVTREEEIKCGC